VVLKKAIKCYLNLNTVFQNPALSFTVWTDGYGIEILAASLSPDVSGQVVHTDICLSHQTVLSLSPSSFILFRIATETENNDIQHIQTVLCLWV